MSPRFPLTIDRLAQLSRMVIADQMGLMALVVMVSVIGLLLSVSGLELVVKPAPGRWCPSTRSR